MYIGFIICYQCWAIKHDASGLCSHCVTLYTAGSYCMVSDVGVLILSRAALGDHCASHYGQLTA